MRPISEVLKSALPEKLLLHARIGEIKSRWGEVVGDALAKRTEPVMFEHDAGDCCLVVSAKTPASAQKIKLTAHSIIQKMNKSFNIEIKNIRV